MIDYLSRSLRQDREEEETPTVGRGFPDAPPSETVTLRKGLTASGFKPLQLHKPASGPFVPPRVLAPQQSLAPRFSVGRGILDALPAPTSVGADVPIGPPIPASSETESLRVGRGILDAPPTLPPVFRLPSDQTEPPTSTAQIPATAPVQPLLTALRRSDSAADFVRRQSRTFSVTLPDTPARLEPGLTAQELDRAVERDARRYDGGFSLY